VLVCAFALNANTIVRATTEIIRFMRVSPLSSAH
jgi:hypothetical protein